MSRLPIAGPSLARRLRQQERTATREANASPFSRSGSGVTDVDEVTYEGVLKVLGQMVVDGTLVVNGPTTLAGALGVTGATTVGGTMTSADFDGNLAAGDAGTTGWAMNAARVAIGELFLRPGSVGNDVLAAPVAAGQGSAAQTNFATALTDQDFASAYVDVPAGFSRALVMLVVTAGAINSSGSVDYLFLSAGINSTSSREIFATASAGGATSITTARSALLTGLSGGQIHIRCRLHTQGNAWAAHASNRAYTEGVVIFLR